MKTDETRTQHHTAVGDVPTAALRGARREHVPAERAVQRVLVVPAFNEEKTVVQVLEGAAPFVDRVVVVDDGSYDYSHGAVTEWALTVSLPVDVLRHRINRGMSGALISGFAHVYQLLQAGSLAPSDVVVNIDTDGQHDPTEIPTLVAHLLERDCDVALGRRDMSGYPRYKVVGNRGLSFWASLLAGYRYPDVECGFRAMRAATIPSLLEYFSGHRYGCAQEMGVLLPRLGYRVDNNLPVRILYYRRGARFQDGIVNGTMGLLAAVRVLFRWRADAAARSARLLAALEPRALPPNGQSPPPEPAESIGTYAVRAG